MVLQCSAINLIYLVKLHEDVCSFDCTAHFIEVKINKTATNSLYISTLQWCPSVRVCFLQKSGPDMSKVYRHHTAGGHQLQGPLKAGTAVIKNGSLLEEIQVLPSRSALTCFSQRYSLPASSQHPLDSLCIPCTAWMSSQLGTVLARTASSLLHHMCTSSSGRWKTLLPCLWMDSESETWSHSINKNVCWASSRSNLLLATMAKWTSESLAAVWALQPHFGSLSHYLLPLQCSFTFQADNSYWLIKQTINFFEFHPKNTESTKSKNWVQSNLNPRQPLWLPCNNGHTR